MTADMSRAHLDHLGDQPAGLPVGVDAELAAVATLGLDLVDQGRPGRVALPAHAPEALVEMGVRLDQAGDHQPAGGIEHRGIG